MDHCPFGHRLVWTLLTGRDGTKEAPKVNLAAMCSVNGVPAGMEATAMVQQESSKART